MMQQSGTDMTVIAFIIMPAPVNNYAVESLRGQVRSCHISRAVIVSCNPYAQATIKMISEAVNDVKEKIGHKIFDGLLTGGDDLDRICDGFRQNSES